MKATSKLISVVLILAMCLSMFTVSGFAANQVVIGETTPVSGGAVVAGSTYSSPGAESELVLNDETATTAAAVAAPVVNEPVTVTDAAALAAAVSKGGKVVLGANITLAESLQLAAGTELNMAGYTLAFQNAGAAQKAALVANGNATVFNGILLVAGTEVADAKGNVTKTGFESVAVAETGNLLLSGVGVTFNAPETMSIFGQGVVLSYGSYNRDVRAWSDLQVFDLVLNENGRFVLKEKAEETAEAAVEEVAEAVEEVAEEAEAAEGEAVVEETPAEEAAEVAEEAVEGEEAAAEEAAEEAEAAEGEEAAEEAEAAEGEEAAEEAEAVEEAEAAEGEAVVEEAAEGEEAAVEEAAEEVAEPVVDETPVDIVEEEEKVYEEEVRVDEAAEADTEGLVTLTATEETTGAVVIVTGKNLPEGLTLVVKPLSLDSIGGLEEGERAVLALDISLVDAEGNEYEPKDDPNVGAVSVQIKHASLGNLEEDESLTLYHIQDDVTQTVASATQSAEDALDFATGSFSPFVITATTGAGTALTGSTGEAHKKVIKITNTTGDIYIKGSGGLKFTITGGATPESISVIDPDYVSSGNAEIYKAGYLIYGTDYTLSNDPATNPNADPITVTVKDEAIANAPEGKWAFVFWFKDTTDTGSTRVYLVQYVTIVNSANNDIKAISPLDEYGNIYVEKCDYDPIEIFVTADVDSFSIVDKSTSATVVSYDWSTDKNKVSVNTSKYKNKTYYASEMFTVSDYVATDAVGHQFIAGKTLKLNKALIDKLDFGEYKITVSQKNHFTTPENAKSKTFDPVTLVPGIAVADGLNDYIKGKNVWIKFIACAPIDYDADGTLAIWIGGQKIGHEYYSISNDHQTLWIYRNLLDQLLSNNTYTLTARLWRYGKDYVKETYYPATASFNILAAGSTSYKSPKTGDDANVALWASVLVLSGAAVVALIPKKKRAGK